MLLTEALTAIFIVALPFLDIYPALFALPLLGVAVNGTSSALYGSVPEFAGPAKRQRAFAIFYTAQSVRGPCRRLYTVFSAIVSACLR